MNKYRVVSAYVPLTVENMDREGFLKLGRQLESACAPDITVFKDFPFEDCWLAKRNPPWRAANPISPDRFKTADQHVRSNLIQHSPLQWMTLAAAERPDVDVWVWLGYSIMKQGDFTGKRIREPDVWSLLEKVKRYDFSHDVPMPGITPKAPVLPHGNNWRFCGSTIVMPAKWLPAAFEIYKYECMKFIKEHGAIPLDLAIWPSVEANSTLPLTWYQAEYDATQLTNFPG